MKPSLHRLLAIVSLLLVLVEGPAFSSLVLCVEPDGQVNVETSLAGIADDDCSGCRPSAPSEGGAEAPAPEKSCPCIDVALDLSMARVSTERQVGTLELAHTIVALPSVPAPPCAVRELRRSDAPGARPAVRTLLGSIVIRV